MERRRMMAQRLGGRGFTLIEVMIVILIVLMLGGLVAWNLMGTKDEAKAGVVKIQMNTIVSTTATPPTRRG
jgi:prepilin-type N-terminal cleavage/methylation domain-containing protein